MSYITDRRHLLTVAESGIAAIEQLAHAWLEEDHTACAPRTGATGGPTTGGSTANPTATIATNDHGIDRDKYRDRDRLGSTLLTLVARLNDAVNERQPRHTGGPCRCCDDETATHGRDDDGHPVECWACWMYRRKNGYRCGPDIHDGRPQVRMCECPPECCEVCPDKVSPERTKLSDRCAQRLSRRRRELHDQEAAS